MKFRTTIFLLVVLAALGLYVYLSGRNEPAEEAETTETTETTDIPVWQFNPADVSTIEVQSEIAGQVRLEKASEGWVVVAPERHPADALRVTQVVTDLSKLSASRTIEPPGDDRSPYGLDVPHYEVRVLGMDDQVIGVLHLGDKNPGGTGFYVQRGDEPGIYLVNSFVLDPVIRWLSDPPVQPTPFPTMVVASPVVVLSPTTLVTPTAPAAPVAPTAPTVVQTNTPLPSPSPTPSVRATGTLPAPPPTSSPSPTPSVE
ncbi:MAG: DUF4340 domain-containing protein [Chloroflexaceae bacterium]|nr:DUF4340 domain-containing protein [Chloroflexaceae bacterium]